MDKLEGGNTAEGKRGEDTLAAKCQGGATDSSLQPLLLLPESAMLFVQLARPAQTKSFEAQMERYSRHLEDVLVHGDLKDASLPMMRLRAPSIPHDALPALAHVPSFCLTRATLVPTALPCCSG